MKKALKIIGLIILFCVLLTAFEIYISSNWLKVNEFELEADNVDEPVRAVILSDLHDHDFGDDIINKIRDQHPDLIIMAGDMLNKDTDKEAQLFELIGNLKNIAPVFYGYGNHEMDYMQIHGTSLKEKLEDSGCTVLDYEYTDIEINGNRLRIGGLYDYPYGTGDCYAADAPEEVKVFMNDYLNTDRYKIMIAHRPDSYVFGDDTEVYDIDLVISGHLHGGQVVIPFKGGVWGGDQGWFPKYVHGLYKKDKIHMLITSGLGSSRKKLPRMNNIPEIMVLNLE